MKINEFKNRLASVTPEVPEHFHNRVEMTLENIVTQEAQMKESTKQAIKTAGRFSRRTLVIASNNAHKIQEISGHRPGTWRHRFRGGPVASV